MVNISNLRAATLVLALLAVPTFGPAQTVTVTADRTNGVYEAGETVHWRVNWSGGTNVPEARYTFLKGGLRDVGNGTLIFTNGVAVAGMRLDTPGTVLFAARWQPDGADRARKTLGGAVAAPDRIGLSATRPADFDAFWESKLKELAAVPANPKLERVDVGKTNLSYSKITLDNIRGTHIQGQIARPVAGEKFPALLIPQWAGVYPLQKGWATDRAAEGWLVLNILAHDLPIDEPEAFYKEQAAGPLKDYWSIGNDDRETSYFLRMYLSCYRAAEYLASRPDWDGKTLVVLGGSQGGQQSLVTAGLHPKITAALASVPAGCDMLGPDAGRKGGWPQWYSNVNPGKDAAKVREASRYFDVANFAPSIKCPVLVGVGLLDETCPPAGIFATMNQITSPKEIVILPNGGHQDENGSHGHYNRRCYSEWLPVLQQGKPAPVQN